MRPDGSRYKALPDVFVYPHPIEQSRGSVSVGVDGPPALIIEVLSESTYDVDLDLDYGKGFSYARAGVREYLALDPTGAFIEEQGRGWRLVDGVYHAWEPDALGRWQSESIAAIFGMEGTLASVYTRDGERQLREGEVGPERARLLDSSTWCSTISGLSDCAWKYMRGCAGVCDTDCWKRIVHAHRRGNMVQTPWSPLLTMTEQDLRFMLTLEDDTEEAPWMVMGDLQFWSASGLAHALRNYVHEQGLGWYVASMLPILYHLPREAPRERKRQLAPDSFVAFVADHSRSSYDLEQEGAFPPFVLEVVSPSSAAHDLREKRRAYAVLGAAEYALFTPHEERPSELAGYRRGAGGTFEVWSLDEEGRLWSEVLGLYLVPRGALLLAQTPEGRLLLTPEEEAEARREAEVVRRRAEEAWQQEATARQQAEARQHQAEERQRMAEEKQRMAEAALQQEAAARQQEVEARRQAVEEVARLRRELAHRDE